MIFAYLKEANFTAQEVVNNNIALLDQAIWIDLISPTKEEEKLVEQKLGIALPTREEMSEIEPSSRLYKDQGNLYMTAPVIAKFDTAEPEMEPVTFVLTAKQLVTIRFIQPSAFRLFAFQLQKLTFETHLPGLVLRHLLDAIVDRMADILELMTHGLEEKSKIIFRPARTMKLDYKALMQEIGRKGDLNSKAYASLTALIRLVDFLEQGNQLTTELDNELNLRKDLLALTDHSNFLSNKVNFLLDAIVGLVSIDQNQIIKILSVAAVIFLPPTLIASIYGMNFKFMPELSWKWGFGFAIFLMFLSAWLPYKYFKKKKYL